MPSTSAGGQQGGGGGGGAPPPANGATSPSDERPRQQPPQRAGSGGGGPRALRLGRAPTDSLSVLGATVLLSDIPKFIASMGESLRTNLGDASGADALEVLGLSWVRRAALPGELMGGGADAPTVPLGAAASIQGRRGSGGGGDGAEKAETQQQQRRLRQQQQQQPPPPLPAATMHHRLELKRRAGRACALLEERLAPQGSVPPEVCAFLFRPEDETPYGQSRGMAPADMLADERRLLKLAARAAAREAARVLDLLPANVATPRGPVAVTSQLRRSAACWAAHARAEDTKGFARVRTRSGSRRRDRSS